MQEADTLCPVCNFNLVHPLYGNRCEDCWVESSGLPGHAGILESLEGRTEFRGLYGCRLDRRRKEAHQQEESKTARPHPHTQRNEKVRFYEFQTQHNKKYGKS